MKKILREIPRALLMLVIIILVVAAVAAASHHLFFIWLQWNILVSVLFAAIVAWAIMHKIGSYLYRDCK